MEIELPIEAFHWLHGDNGSCFPHTLIIAGDRAKVTFVDYYESADANAPGFACAVNDLWLGAGAQITYVCAQNWSRQALAVQINATVVGRDAHAKSLFAQLGTHVICAAKACQPSACAWRTQRHARRHRSRWRPGDR